MTIIYVEGHGDPSRFPDISQKFRDVFGGEVSSITATFKSPASDETESYFCMKLDVDELEETLHSFAKKKIDFALRQLTSEGAVKEISFLERTADLDLIFSLGEQHTKKEDSGKFNSFKERASSRTTLSPGTTSDESNSDVDELGKDSPKKFSL